MKFFWYLTFGLVMAKNLQAQNEGRDIRLSGYAGGTYSKISGIHSTILSEPFFINYHATDSIWKEGIVVGLAFEYRFLSQNDENEASRCGIETDISYSQQWGAFRLDNYATDFNYKLQFRYNYLNFNALGKVFFGKKMYRSKNEEKLNFLYGLHIDGGLQVSVNLTPENIKYTPGGTGNLPTFGSALEQEQQLRNVLKGQNVTASMVAGFGFRFLKRATLDMRVFRGLNDLIKTQVNSYNFIETNNMNTTFQATLGYSFTL